MIQSMAKMDEWGVKVSTLTPEETTQWKDASRQPICDRSPRASSVKITTTGIGNCWPNTPINRTSPPCLFDRKSGVDTHAFCPLHFLYQLLHLVF